MRLLLLASIVLCIALYAGAPHAVAQGGIPETTWELNSGDQKGNITQELGKLNLIRANTAQGERFLGLPAIVGRIMGWLLSLVGLFALAMFTYAGLNWMLSRGNKETVKKSKDIIFWVTAGLIIIFISYIAIQYVLVFLYGAIGA